MNDETAGQAPAFQAPPPVAIGLTPYLTIPGGRGQEAVRFYEAAFGAEELFRNLAEDGRRVLHGRLRINGALVFFSDDFPEMRGGAASPPAAGVMLHLQVDDADAWAARATKAGAEVVMPVAQMFWGDRYGHVRDPFGHTWSGNVTLDKTRARYRLGVKELHPWPAPFSTSPASPTKAPRSRT